MKNFPKKEYLCTRKRNWGVVVGLATLRIAQVNF